MPRRARGSRSFAQQRAGDGTWLALPLLATAVSLLMVWMYRTWAQHRLSVRWARVSLLAVLFAAVVLASLYVVPVALGHNLQTKMVYMFFDPVTQAMLDARIPTITPPTPLLRVGDELGLIIKVVPRDGTTTGVGGYIDFYVPNGTSVVDVVYVEPNAGGGYDRVGMKGQSLIAIGDGPIGAKTTPALIGLSLGPNINGVTTNTVTSAGLARGTIAGVYGDVGIFYSTDPRTAYNTWASNGGYDGNPATNDNTITNNSGDVVLPLNQWDAEQLLAYGSKAPAIAILDAADQRGNAPWGLANAVAGPQSGYAWQFNRNVYTTSGAIPSVSTMGPWNRIKYPGSLISDDQPGLISTVLGRAAVDGSQVGFSLSPSTPLTATVAQTDTTSPKAIRWSIGQTTQFVPEYAYVKIRVNDLNGIMRADGCPYLDGGTFGGDAGGSDNGKDHLWRYHEPTRVTWSGCLGAGKVSTRGVVAPGDIFCTTLISIIPAL